MRYIKYIFILSVFASINSITPLKAQTSYSEYAAVIDNAKVVGRYIGALEACNSFIDENIFNSSRPVARAVASTISQQRKKGADDVRQSIIAALEKVDTEFDLISKIDEAIQETREENSTKFSSALFSLTSDTENMVQAGEFCLNVMTMSELMTLNAELSGSEEPYVVKNASEVMEIYASMSPLK